MHQYKIQFALDTSVSASKIGCSKSDLDGRADEEVLLLQAKLLSLICPVICTS